jgi:hypothetical protein
MGVRDPDNTTCCTLIKVKVKQSLFRPVTGPEGSIEVEASFLDFWHMKVVKLSALGTGHLELVFVRWLNWFQDQKMWLEGLCK